MNDLATKQKGEQLIFFTIMNDIFFYIPARYLQDGQIIDVEENGGLLDSVSKMDFLPGFSLEGKLTY